MTTPTHDERHDEVFESRLHKLSRVVVAETPLNDILCDVVEIAKEAISGCDHCGVSIVSNRISVMATTAVATDGTTFSIDSLQYDLDEGPCLTALRTSEVISVPSFAEEARFPRFKTAALKAGMRSSLSFPLVVRDRCIGALNLYSTNVDAFDESSMNIGLRLADQASIALANAQSHEEAVNAVEHLTTALDRRGVIERAKGILMATRRINDDAAFDILRKSSQFQNRKLFDVALDILETHERSLDLNRVSDQQEGRTGEG
jgi:GAF domain-containing protein